MELLYICCNDYTVSPRKKKKELVIFKQSWCQVPPWLPQVSFHPLTFHLDFHFYSYLLPHLLPPKPAMDIHCFRQHTSNTIQRQFKMSFVPAGFWERFIARMLISLSQMDLQVHRAFCLFILG